MNRNLAVLDPSSEFDTPEHVSDCAELATEQKIEILKRWAYDGSESAVAAAEGMPEGPRAGLQRRILLAFHALGVNVDSEHAGPAK